MIKPWPEEHELHIRPYNLGEFATQNNIGIDHIHMMMIIPSRYAVNEV